MKKHKRPARKSIPSKFLGIGVSVDKAAEMLNKSPQAVRQLIQRNKLHFQLRGRNIELPLDEVLIYHAVKKGIPSWEENIKRFSGKTFVNLQAASAGLMVQESYIIRLIKQGALEGYATVSGDIMISQESINAHMRTLDVDTTDL